MRFGPVSIALLLTIGAAGCQTMRDVSDAVTGPSSTGDQRHAPAEVPQAPTATLNQAAATPRAAVGTGLGGLTAAGLRSAWGEPTLKRSEAGAELWQYHGSNCTLLVYLYPGADDEMTVSHAEAVPGGADESAVAACAKAAGKAPLKPIS